MTTALQIIQRAFATSRDNDAGRVAEISGELLEVLNDAIEAYIAEGGRLNDKFFGERIVVGFDNGGWARPAEAEVVLRLEASSATSADVIDGGEAQLLDEGTEIADLPIDQRHQERGRPAVFDFGQTWWPAGRTGDPSDGDIVVFATTSTDRLTTTAASLPAKFPRAGHACLKWELAIYLAQKDGGRDGEIVAFTAQLEKAKARYLSFLENATRTEVRSYGHAGGFASGKSTPS